MIVPVVTGDIDPAALEDLILLCARYHRLRAGTSPARQTSPAHDIPGDDIPGDDIPGPSGPAGAQGGAPVPAGLAGRAARQAEQAAAVADALADLEHQILAKILQVLSGPGGAASFLRRNLLGKGLNGPSLPLDVGQTDDIPVHLRRLVALRDQTCQYPGGCDQPGIRVRAPPRGPPGRRRPHQPHQSQGLLLVAPPRGAAPAGLDADRPPRRHQPGHQPGREDHPQPQPATPPRVTAPARHNPGKPSRRSGCRPDPP